MPFQPFDDTQTTQRDPEPTAGGMDTSAWDFLRQGVEITRAKLWAVSSQPKFWTGNTDGHINIEVYGQSNKLSELSLESSGSVFEDLPNFEPVSFLNAGTSYPLPVYQNNGPSQQYEASIEPLTIPFRRASNEMFPYAKGIHGLLETGGIYGVGVKKQASEISLFVDYIPPVSSSFFLDEGGGYMGNVRLDTFNPLFISPAIIFDDNQSLNPTKDISSNLANVLIESVWEGEESLLPYGKRSATAGRDVYGADYINGTDSIAFAGWARG